MRTIDEHRSDTVTETIAKKKQSQQKKRKEEEKKKYYCQ